MLKKASELWPKLKTKTNAFILCFMILNAILTVHLFMRHDINSKLALIVTLIAEVLFELVMVWLFYRLKRKGAPIEKMFLAFVIPIGLLFIAFLPPQQTPDAYAHLTRAYEISQGQLVAKAGEDGVASATLPVELRHYIEHDSGYGYNANVLWQPLSGETYEEQKFYPSAAGYNFLIYAPHAVGILIGRGLRLPLYFILALGRVFSLLVFALLGYFAIKFTPRFKMLFMFLALMPMTMQLVTGYSADALTLGVAFFLVGYALKLIYDDKIKKLSRWQIAGIYIVAAIMGICKTVYFPLCALFLLIPYRKFGSKSKKWINAIFAAGLAAAAVVVWMKLQKTSSGTLPVNDQFGFILTHPLRYIMYILGTILDYLSGFYLSSTFGTSLGAWRFDIPYIYFYLAFVVAALVLVRGTEHYEVKPIVRFVAWAVFTTITVAFMTVMFTQWTKAGEKYVDGVQGRYFIPILTLVPLMFSSSKKTPATKRKLEFSSDYPLLFNLFFCVCGIVTIIMVDLA